VSANNWQVLADAARERREALGLRQADLEQRGGPSHGTVRNIEQATRDKYAPRTFATLDRALAAPPGWAEALVKGEDLGISHYAVLVEDTIARAAIGAAGGNPPEVGAVWYVSDLPAWRRVMRQIGSRHLDGGPPGAATLTGAGGLTVGGTPGTVVAYGGPDSVAQSAQARLALGEATNKVATQAASLLSTILEVGPSSELPDDYRDALRSVLNVVAANMPTLTQLVYRDDPRTTQDVRDDDPDEDTGDN